MHTYKPGDKPVPDYKVDSFLGEGGYGCVYKVTNVRTGIPKALKVITLKDTQGYKEYTALALFKEIRHPNLVPIDHYWLLDEKGQEIRFGEDESLNIAGRGTVILLILLGLGDRSLADRLKECIEKKQTGIPLTELMDYMDGVAKAIDFLNTPKTIGSRDNVAIQHGDIKPGNVLLVGGDSIQVGDYGLAQAISVTPETGKSRTTTGSMAGTPEYAAPEQVGGKASRNSDQFSLAISFYEMRTGRLPFDDQANRYACLAMDGLDFSLVSPFEQEVMQKATHKQFAQRYNSCRDFVKALRKAHAKAGLIDRSMEFQALPDSIQAPIKPPPTPPSFLDRLRPDAEDFVQGFQLVKCLGKNADEQLWQVLRIDDSQPFLLKIILGTNPNYAFEQYNSLSKLHSVTYDKILNLENLWIVDRAGREVASDQIKHPGALSDKVVLVLIESVKTTLQDHVLAMKKTRYNDRLKRKWFDVTKHICMGTDYWNKHCYHAYHALNPAKILVNMYDQIKIDSAGVSSYFRDGSPATSRLTDAHVFDAPEIFDNKYYDQSDQYSLAMIYYWLCTGKTYFSPDVQPDDIKDNLRDNPTDFSAQFPEEAEVLARATLLDPQERFPDSISFLEAFEDALMITGVGRTVKPPPRTPPRTPVAPEPAIQVPSSTRLATAAPPISVPPTPASPPSSRGSSPRTPRHVEGGTIQFTADEIEQAKISTPKPPPEQQRKTPRGEEWRKRTEKDTSPAKPPKPQPVKVEPQIEEPIRDLDDLDDEPERKSNWLYWVLLLVLLICVFGLTLFLLRNLSHSAVTLLGIESIAEGMTAVGNVGGTSSDPKNPILEDVVASLTEGIRRGGDVESPPQRTQPAFTADYQGLKEKLISKSLPEISDVLKTQIPILKQAHSGDSEAGKKLDAMWEFVEYLTKAKPYPNSIVDRTKWIRDYKKAKSELNEPELFASQTTTLEDERVKEAQKFIEKVDENTTKEDWGNYRTYYEAVEAFADDKAKKLLKFAIVECEIESGKEEVIVPEVLKDDVYGKYLKVLQYFKTRKLEPEKALPFLSDYLKTSDADLLLKSSYRQGNAYALLKQIITSCRIKNKPFAAFEDKKTELVKNSLEMLIENSNGEKPDTEKTRIRAKCEIAMLMAEKDPADAIKRFSAIPWEKYDNFFLNESEQVELFTSYITVLAKLPGNETLKAKCAQKLLEMYAKKTTGIEVDVIVNQCVKTLIEAGFNLKAIGNEQISRSLAQSLFDLTQSVLREPSEVKKVMGDDYSKVDSLLLKTSSLASQLNSDHELNQIYCQLIKHGVLSFSSPLLSIDRKSLSKTASELSAFYKNTKQGTHYSKYVIQTLKTLDDLKSAIEDQQASASVIALHESCSRTVRDFANFLDSANLQITDFERVVCHSQIAYAYNVLANSLETASATEFLSSSLLHIDKTEKLNKKLAVDAYDLELHSIRGLTFEDQAWVLRDPKTFQAAYTNALDEYNHVQQNAAVQSRQKAKAIVDTCRCIYRYSVHIKSDSQSSFERRKRLAETMFTDFLNDIAFADKYPDEKIESLFFMAKLTRPMLLQEGVGTVEEMKNEVSKLDKAIANLELALPLSIKHGYYHRSIILELIFSLEDQLKVLASPGRTNVFTISNAANPGNGVTGLLKQVHDNIDRLKTISNEYSSKSSTICAYCTATSLLYESASLGGNWSKSKDVDDAYENYKKSLNDPNKEVLKRASSNALRIVSAQLKIAFPSSDTEKADPKFQQIVADRWGYVANAMIETSRLVNKDPNRCMSDAAQMSRSCLALYVPYPHAFMLKTSIDCMIRAIQLDTGINSPFLDKGSDPSSSLKLLMTQLEKEPTMKADYLRLITAIQTKWGKETPEYLSGFFEKANK